MSDKIDPAMWWDADKYKGPGMTAYVRTAEFENTGNNEGTITWEVAVLSDDGELLLHKHVYHEWEYFTALDVEFSSDGSSITLAVQHGDTNSYPLDGSVVTR